MNFDVNQVLKQTPVQRLQQKNEEQETGIVVDHVDPSDVHVLKSSADRDVEDVVKELPNTMQEIANLGGRIAQAKMKLGLGEGGFVDQEIELINYRTGQVEGVEWRTSAQINAEFIAREPIMTDEQLEDFLKMYFVEFDLRTGEVKPPKYPRTRGLKCSVTFPDPPKKSRRLPERKPPEPPKTEPTPQEPVTVMDDPPQAPSPTPDRVVRYTTEERTVGKRKKLGEQQIHKLSEMILDRNSFACTAVASRYKCDVTAITFEEYDQLQNMVETSKLARETKLWSIIYRHVKNPTIGEFKSFNDFCEHTAWVDRKRFWFAMMCTMRSDTDTVRLRCVDQVFKPIDENSPDISEFEPAFENILTFSELPTSAADLPSEKIYTDINEDGVTYRYIPIIEDGLVRWTAVEREQPCDETYDYTYLNRDLLDTVDQPEWVVREIDKINAITAMNEAIDYHNDGPLMNKRIIPLNDAVSVEVGIKSVADVLRSDYKYMLSDEINVSVRDVCVEKIRQEKGNPEYAPTDDEIDDYLTNELTTAVLIPILSMSIIDKVIVTIDGEEYESDVHEDIINTLSQCLPENLTPFANEDDKSTLIYRFYASYEPSFSYKNCTCPKCGSKSDIKITNPDDLVFTLSRTLGSTKFDIANL